MNLKFATEPATLQEPLMREYSLSINGVLEIMSHINDEAFFDGLFDTILEYVEERHAFAGLSMSHKECEYMDVNGNEESNGKKNRLKQGNSSFG